MKEQKKYVRETGQGHGGSSLSRSYHFRSERGVVLIVVIVLSAVSLLIMTTLIYLITTGTQVSGLNKRYKTALEAGIGGSNIFHELIGLRAETAGTNAFTANLNSSNIYTALTTSVTCRGQVGTATYTGLAAKLMTPSTSWVDCDSSVTIDSAVPSTYDMKIELGTTTKYSVYAKIVTTIEGNTSGGIKFRQGGVVHGGSGSGSITVMTKPYILAIEVLSENNARKDERAKLSVVYQY